MATLDQAKIKNLAGPELNALVAEHVMGWVPPTGALPGTEKDWECVWIEDRARPREKVNVWINMVTRHVATNDEYHLAFYWIPPFTDEPGPHEPFDYWGSTSYAWRVVDQLNKLDYLVTLKQELSDQWAVNVRRRHSLTGGTIAQAEGRLMGIALCRAALQAVGSKKEEIKG